MSDNMLGQFIGGKYKVIDILGKGGMGTVYLAENINLSTKWAIKEIKKDYESTLDLLLEPNILKNLDHPSLPRIVDIIENNDFIYIIEDFIDGESLDKMLEQKRRVEEEKVIDWAKQLCDVLHYLHNQNPNPIIYRDMKPGNIIYTKSKKIKLIDFGIAREFKDDVTSDTVLIGTRGYAAPEQYGGDYQSDARTDIYSLGVTLYELLTGKGPNDPPFEVKPVRSVIPSLSEGIEYIIEKCTQQDPILRYQSIREILKDLNNIDELGEGNNTKALIGRGKAVTVTKEKIVGTIAIGIAGTMKRIGTTHMAIGLAQFLRVNGFKVALLELHDSESFKSICNAFEDVKSNENYFTLYDLNFYPYGSQHNISDVIQQDYDYIVMDMGAYQQCNLEEFKRSNSRIIVSGVKEWELLDLESIIKTSDGVNKNNYCFNFADDYAFQEVKSNMGQLKCFQAPYYPNPFSIKECNEIFANILRDVIPETRKSPGNNRNGMFRGLFNKLK